MASGGKKSSTKNNFFGMIVGIVMILFIISAWTWKLWNQKKDNEILALKYKELVSKAEEAVSLLSQLQQGSHISQNLRLEDGSTQSKQSNSKRDIIIGMAQDTDPKNLVVFCASLRSVSNAHVVIFVNTPVPQRHNEIAMKYNIELIPFELSSVDERFQKYHPSTLRWIFIYNYFNENNRDKMYARVWLIDVRDSMFQSDPFSILPYGESAFHAFKGVESKTISQCGWNGGWVKDCFGNSQLSAVGNSPIICSGVSVGSIDTVLPYLQKMRDIVMGIDTSATFPQCERNGVDQGAHNVLVHTGQVKNIKIWNQQSSPVINLQAKRAVVKNGVVTNLDGNLASVVHQYDRYEDLQRALFKKYVYWIDTSDPMSEWNSMEECANYNHIQNSDSLKGKCDLRVRGGATGPSSCCKFCSDDVSCGAFTFYAGQCFLKSKACSAQEIQSRSPQMSLLAGAFTGYLKQ